MKREKTEKVKNENAHNFPYLLTPHLTPFGLGGGGAGNIGKKDVAKQGGGGSAVSPTLRVNNKLLVMKVKDSVANSL